MIKCSTLWPATLMFCFIFSLWIFCLFHRWKRKAFPPPFLTLLMFTSWTCLLVKLYFRSSSFIVSVFFCCFFREVVVKDPRRTNSPVWLSRVPVDDVWIRSYYPQIKLSIEECIIRHKEYADPTMLDNLEGFIYADMELDMKTTKKVKNILCL